MFTGITRRRRALAAVCVLTLTSTVFVLAPATAPAGAQEAPTTYLDQQLDDDPHPANGDRQACSTTTYPGQRSLVGGTPQGQTFRPSRSDLVEVDVCLTANVTSSFSVAIYAADDAGVPVGDAIGRGLGTATRASGSQTRFETVSFGSDLGLTPGERYVLQLEGPSGGSAPAALLLSWRATCPRSPVLGGCAADAPTDQYPDGRAIDFPPRTDFAFRTWTSTSANLRGELVDVPRHVCRDRAFDATVRVRNMGTATVRSTTAQLEIDSGTATADSTEPITVPDLGPGASVDLPVTLLLDTGDLAGHDGRVVHRLVIDDHDVVVETDETDNVSDTGGMLTGCESADIESIDLTAGSPTSSTGVSTVPIHTLPFSTLSFGSVGIEANGFQHNGFQHNGFQHNGFQHNGFQHNPLLGGTLSENGFQHNPADANQRHNGAGNTTSFLYGAPLSVLDDIDLPSVDLIRDGGWTAILRTHGDLVRASGSGSTPLDHLPLHELSLLDAMTLDPAPAQPITFAELDIADSGLAGLVWSAVAAGATPLDGLPIGGSWCDLLASDGIDCGEHEIDTATDTLVTVNLLGLDMDLVPFSDLTLDRVSLHPDSPLAAAPLHTGSTLPGFDARRTAWAGVVVDAGGFGGTVRCETGLCNGTSTLSDVSAQNAFTPGKRFRDLLAALPTEVLATADLGTAILGMVHTLASLPFESADLDSVLLSAIAQDGARTTYELTVTADEAGASLVDPTFSLTLPPDFALVQESAELEVGDTAAVLRAPTVHTGVAGGFRQQTVRWTTDLHVPHGDTATLVVEAVNGRTLGTHEASGAVAGVDLTDAYAAETGSTAPVSLDQLHEPDDSQQAEASYPTLAPDELFVSHLAEPGDIDVIEIPVPEQPGSEVRVVLSQMAGDYDLAVSGATVDSIAASGFQHNGFQHNGFQHNGFQHNGFQHNPVIPATDSTFEANSAGASAPQTLQDIPLATPVLREHGVRALSIERGEGTTETVRFVSREGESGSYFLQVSGYNDASGPRPFVLRYHVVHPEQIDLGDCQAPPFAASAADPDLLPDPASIDPDTNTLFLVARERLDERYDATRRQAVLDQIDTLIANDDNVSGEIITVDADPDVAEAYGAWDLDRCNPAAANGVGFAIRDLVMSYRQVADIDHLVVIGDDDQIPFIRLRDDAAIGNERSYLSTLVAETGMVDAEGSPMNGTPLTSALAQGLFLADTPLASSEAAEWLDAAYWLPDSAVGRLVGEPETMIDAMQQFTDSSGELDPDILDPTATAVTGYDHIADGAEAVADALDANLTPDARRLISEDHSRADIESKLTFGPSDDDVIVSLNGHSDHARFLPALGNSTGDASDLFEATDLGLPLGSLVLSMGCHFGFDRPTTGDGAITDWADAVAANQGILLADTGYNYGDTETIGGGELYMQVLAENLDGSSTVGQAASQTVTELFARDTGYTSEAFKAVQGVVTYGLPMYRIHGVDDSAEPTTPEADATPTAEAGDVGHADVDVDLTILPPGQTCPEGETCLLREESRHGDGAFYTAVGTHGFGALSVNGEPKGPRLSIDVTDLVPPGQRAHGAVVRSRVTGADLTDFDPVFTTLALSDRDGGTEPQSSDTVFPLRSTEVDTDPVTGRVYLSVLPWAFRATGENAGGAVVGNLRLDTSLSVRLLTSADDDFGGPTVRSWSARRQGSGVAFDLAAAAGTAGPVVGATAVYRDQFGTWHRAELSSADGGATWAGVGALPGTDESPIEVSISIRDVARNDAHSANKGELVPIVNSLELPHQLVSEKVGDNGWFRGPVVVEFPAGATYERRTGPGTEFAPFTGNSFTVADDGVHRFEVRTADKSQKATGIVVAIDSTKPQVAITSPVDGHVYAHDDVITAEYGCSDSGPSDIASCAGDVAPGGLVDPGAGMHSFSVTATDSAGNTHTTSVSYEIEPAPLDFVGFFWPVKNSEWNRIEVETSRDSGDPWGRVVPFVWRIHRAGEWQSDPGLIAATRWQRVTCTDFQRDAVATGSPVHADSWDGQGVWSSQQYRLQGYNARVPDAFYPSCQRFDLTLVDGTVRSAYFQLVVKPPPKKN